MDFASPLADHVEKELSVPLRTLRRESCVKTLRREDPKDPEA